MGTRQVGNAHTHAHTYTHSWSLRCLQAHSNTHWSTVSVAQDDRRRRRRRTVFQSDEKRREKTHRTRRQQTEFWVELCVCGWPGAQAERFGKRNIQTHTHTGTHTEWQGRGGNGGHTPQMVVIKRQLCVSFFGNTQEGEEGNTEGKGKVRSKCKWNSRQGGGA